RGHALARVAITMQKPHAKFGKTAKQGHLLGGNLAGTQNGDRVRSVPPLSSLEALAERLELFVPHRGPQTPASVFEQRRRRPVIRFQHAQGLPPLGTAHAGVYRVLGQWSETDWLAPPQMNVESAAR